MVCVPVEMPPPVVPNNGASAAVSAPPAGAFAVQKILRTESRFLGSGANAVDKTRRLAFADEKGERAYIFNDVGIRATVAKDFPGTIIWPQIGLPENWRVLLAPKRAAFISEGKQTVGHGGISMEEVIVPWVKVTRQM